VPARENEERASFDVKRNFHQKNRTVSTCERNAPRSPPEASFYSCLPCAGSTMNTAMKVVTHDREKSKGITESTWDEGEVSEEDDARGTS